MPVNTGGVRSTVHVTVRETIAVLPQASVAVKVLVCERVHDEVVILPSEEVIVGIPQASEAVAVPSATSIAVVVGLHPIFCVA